MVIHRTPLDFDVRDPEFPHQCRTWSMETRSEIADLIARTEKELAISRAMMTTVDRILATRSGHRRPARDAISRAPKGPECG